MKVMNHYYLSYSRDIQYKIPFILSLYQRLDNPNEIYVVICINESNCVYKFIYLDQTITNKDL